MELYRRPLYGGPSRYKGNRTVIGCVQRSNTDGDIFVQVYYRGEEEDFKIANTERYYDESTQRPGWPNRTRSDN